MLIELLLNGCLKGLFVVVLFFVFGLGITGLNGMMNCLPSGPQNRVEE